MKIVICAVVCALVATVRGQVDSQDDNGLFQDYWSNEFDYDDYAIENNKDNVNSEENIEANGDTNQQLDAEILDDKDSKQILNEEDQMNSFEDYQFEDNRSNVDDKDTVKEIDGIPIDDPIPDDVPKELLMSDDVLNEWPKSDDASNEEPIAADTPNEEPIPDDRPNQETKPDDEPNEEPIPDDAPENNLDTLAESLFESVKEENDLSDKSWENLFNDEEIAEKPESGVWDSLLKDENSEEMPEPEKEKLSLDESMEAMNVDDGNLDDLLDFDGLSAQDPVEHPNLDQVIEEINKLSKESDENVKDVDYNEIDVQNEDVFEDDIFGNKENDETPEDVLKDLNDDLDKLLATLDKLSSNDSDLDNNDDNVEGIDNIDDVQDYEEKYNRPYKEGNILSLRDYIDNFDDDSNDVKDVESPNESSLEQLENVNDDESIHVPITKEMNQVENLNLSEIKEEKIDDSEIADRKLLTDELNDSSELEKLLSEIDDSLVSNEDDNSDLRHPYGNDGLVNDQQPLNEDAEFISTQENTLASDRTTENIATDTILENLITEDSPSTKLVDDLNSSEYNELMAQFAFAHSEDLDVNSEDFAKNVAPIHITLSVEEPTIITSPDYPNPYPTNNIVDWIIEGPGIGIEMNMTHFEVNGALGDYLLVKPGGVDESGTDGLIFSFRLNSERRYRFTNVNRMFVRFEAKPGMSFFNGFSFSARMIWPLPDIGREELPEPEAVLNPPEATLTLHLAGLTLREFEEVKPQFKELIAIIAQQYITENNIDPGLKSTMKVTQITRTAICNIRWPNYETCVEVSFGVPLHYEEDPEDPKLSAEDLNEMWRTYISYERYAALLRDMGLTEYAIPNDRTVLMVWLVISAGVVISMAMLAFALWRFSCFEDYTRMRAFKDSDSVQNEKKTLDLYPTPHQTLPPLYSETDYKWADDKYNDSTRVDMGGFSNKSYMRDNLFEFDSDEDIITPHDRRGTPISPRDVYEV